MRDGDVFKEAVVVTDVMTDPLWADYRQLAQICGLRACWSTPIISAQNEVLGSFAIYRQETRGPNADELALAQVATHITGIAIERKRAEEALHHSEEQIALLQTITMRVATAKDLLALEVVLERVCEKTGWDYAQSWLPRRRWSPFSSWVRCGPVTPQGSEKFGIASERRFGRERVFQGVSGNPNNQPGWKVTRDRNFPRASAATECGLKAALAIPILARDEVIAVIEFFLRARIEQDARKNSMTAMTSSLAKMGMADPPF